MTTARRARFESDTKTVRTALCAEAREGRALHLHAAGRGRRASTWISWRRSRPPRPTSACAMLIEGYPPPYDPRLKHFS